MGTRTRTLTAGAMAWALRLLTATALMAMAPTVTDRTAQEAGPLPTICGITTPSCARTCAGRGNLQFPINGWCDNRIHTGRFRHYTTCTCRRRRGRRQWSALACRYLRTARATCKASPWIFRLAPTTCWVRVTPYRWISGEELRGVFVLWW